MIGEEYEFHIDAYTPSTIPMARLAQYIAELAALFGSPECVHFRKLKKGSVRVVARVAHEAIPKVRARLHHAKDPNASADIRKTYRRIDELLRADNAIGKLLRGTSNVVVFPGRKAAMDQRMGPFTEPGTLDGKIVRIGGTDATAHALIEDNDGNVVSAECTRELAVQLAPFLYQQPVRLIGNARWLRTETGDWEQVSFRAKEFTPLTPDDLVTTIQRLRGLETDWSVEADPLAFLRKLRGDDGAR